MEDTRARWDRAFLEAVDFDTWGQVEEATEGYQRLQVAASAEYVENILMLDMHRRDGIGKLAAVLKLRIQELQAGRDKSAVGLKSMKLLKPFMKDIIVSDTNFPLRNIDTEAILEIDPIEDTLVHQDEGFGNEDDGYDEPGSAPGGGNAAPGAGPKAGAGTLRGRPGNVKSGDQLLSIFIEKWGFKEGADKFRDPQVVVSVRSKEGEPVEAVQETPVAKGKDKANHNYVFFDNWVHIQTSLNKLGSKCAIFFEFRHYKADKKKRSTKAYCMLEMDEIRSGVVQLEVYKKPAIYTRNKEPALLSVKPFYVHLELQIDTVDG
ncbi:hypothetical protein FOA52_004831 [Chlamydomonas sp. UWO 241]|nr:hypothetical protein FOA52_004831 [Chlamydomonas sp. UWO 241]